MGDLEYGEGRTCSVCGSRITDRNPDGIGVECRYAWKKAKITVHNQVKERGFKYYGVKAQLLIPIFIEEFKDVKFRNAFKKSFYPSVVEQWESRGYLSNKQVGICEDWLLGRIDYKEYQDTIDQVTKIQWQMIERWEPNPEEKDIINKLAGKYRQEFRANQRR